MTHVLIVSFTELGAALGARVQALLPDMDVVRCPRHTEALRQASLSDCMAQAMEVCSLIVCIGAAGIAVRAIAPFLRGKDKDPAVLVLDEAGQYVVPILSGHLGGANAFAEMIAEGLAAQAVITTATDVRQVFAVDSWARAQNMILCETGEIRYLSGALLRGQPIGLRTAFPVDGSLPAGVTEEGVPESGFVLAAHCADRPFAHTLHLVPHALYLGLGCRRDMTEEQIEQAVKETLQVQKIPFAALRAVASIDLKKNEPGLLAFSRKRALPFYTASAETLRAVPGDFQSSALVERVTGVGNVCERAAVWAAGGGTLVCPKTVKGGVTVAIAVENWRVRF